MGRGNSIFSRQDMRKIILIVGSVIFADAVSGYFEFVPAWVRLLAGLVLIGVYDNLR